MGNCVSSSNEQIIHPASPNVHVVAVQDTPNAAPFSQHQREVIPLVGNNQWSWPQQSSDQVGQNKNKESANNATVWPTQNSNSGNFNWPTQSNSKSESLWPVQQANGGNKEKSQNGTNDVHKNKQNKKRSLQDLPNKKQFLSELKQLILSTPQLTILLEKSFFQYLFKLCEVEYWSTDARQLLIKSLMEYIRFSITQLNDEQTNESEYTINNFAERFGKQMYKIVNENKLKNFWIIKSLSYLENFKQLSFTLQNEGESTKLANDVRSLCSNNTTSLIFLSSYFVICCREKEKNKVPISKISENLGKIASKLKEIFSPKSKLEEEMKYNKRSFEETQLKRLASQQFPFKSKQLIFSESNKQAQIQDLIMSIVQQGKKHYSNFTQLTSSCCLSSEGFSYKSNLKLKDRSQEMPMLRVKEKLLKSKIQQFYKQKSYTCNSIDELEKQQVAYLQQVLKQIYEKMDRIQFTVSDILRGKCMFNKIAHINTAAEKIINRVKERAQKGEDIQIVQIDNRLAKITTDLVLKIRIEEIVCQFQLALKFNQAENEIHHKMYQIERSKMFSPVSMLFRWHRQLSNEYFGIVDKILNESSRQDMDNLKNEVGQLKKMVNYLTTNQSYSSINMTTKKQYEVYLGIKKEAINLTVEENMRKLAPLRSGIALKEMRKYKEAQQPLIRLYLSFLNDQQFLFELGDVLRLQGKFKDALKYYGQYLENYKQQQKSSKKYHKCKRNQAECLWEMGKNSEALQILEEMIEYQRKEFGEDSLQYIETLSYIGKVQSRLGKYRKSIEILEKSYKMYESIKDGVLEQNYPQIFKNIGQVYIYLKNLTKALEYLNKSLSLSENINGKQSYQTSQIYITFGRVYEQMGKYKEAEQHYEKYLYIVENMMGKQNMYYGAGLFTLSTLYRNQGRYNQSFDYLKKSATLMFNVSGENSSEYMQVRNGLGLYYFSIGHLNLAKQEFLKCINILYNIGEDENPNISVLYGNLAKIQQRLKNFQEAQKYYESQKDAVKRIFGQESVNYAFLLHNIGTFYYQSNQKQKAVDSFNRCLQLYEKNNVENSEDYRVVLSSAGDFYARTQNKIKSKECLQKANKIIQATLGSDSPQFIKNKKILDNLDTYIQNFRLGRNI